VKKSTWLWIAAGAAAIYLWQQSKKGGLKGLDGFCQDHPTNPYSETTNPDLWEWYEKACPPQVPGPGVPTIGTPAGFVNLPVVPYVPPGGVPVTDVVHPGWAPGISSGPRAPVGQLTVDCGDPSTWINGGGPNAVKRQCGRATYQAYVKSIKAWNAGQLRQCKIAHTPKRQCVLKGFGDCVSGFGVCP